jgi:hypothetical protein
VRGRLSGTGCPLSAERFEAASMQTVFEDLMVMINEGGTWWYLKHHVHDETSNIFKQKMASRDRGPARSDPAIVRALDSLTNVLYFFIEDFLFRLPHSLPHSCAEPDSFPTSRTGRTNK